MYDSFSFARYFKVLSYDFNHVLSKYLKMILPTAIVVYFSLNLISLILFGSIMSYFMRSACYSAVIMIVIFLSPFFVYNDVNSRTKGVLYAMLPSSCQEKFLSQLVYSLFFFPVTIILSCGLLDLLLCELSPLIAGESVPTVFRIGNDLLGWEPFLMIVYVVSLAMAGNIYFRKNKMLKTIFVFLLMNVILSILLALMLFSNLQGEHLVISNIQEFNTEMMEHHLITYYRYFVTIVAAFSIFFLLSSYQRMRVLKY